MSLEFIEGHYFSYCQFCEHDEKCELKHYEYMGVESKGEIDRTHYPGHEVLSWHSTTFQRGHDRAACAGRFGVTDSLFYKLACECGTVIGGLDKPSGKICAKFESNKRGKERIKLAEKIAEERGIPLEEISAEDLPELDNNYKAILDY